MVTFYEMYEKMKTSGSESYMFEQLAKYHREVIMDEKRKAGQECITWAADMVQTHFKEHVLILKNEVLHSIGTLAMIEKELEETLLRTIEGERVPDVRSLGEWRKIIALKRSMMNVNASNLFRG